MVRIFGDDVRELMGLLNEVRMAKDVVRVRQVCFGEETEKVYRFKVGFPNGFKGSSVSAWYSVDWRKDRLYMTTREFANYIANVNSGKGGQNIVYQVERLTQEEFELSKKPLGNILQDAIIRSNSSGEGKQEKELGLF